LRQDGSDQLICPSAPPEWDGAFAFGVVIGTPDQPQMAHLAEIEPVTPELLARTEPVSPREVFRFGAPCARAGCHHWSDQGGCSLVERTIKAMAPVVEKIMPCSIRASCRWWHQEGKSACLRCPGIVTDSFTHDEAIHEAATPLHRYDNMSDTVIDPGLAMELMKATPNEVSPVWAVYNRPPAYPDRVIARLFLVHSSTGADRGLSERTPWLLMADTVEEVEAMLPPDSTRMEAQ
jgi:hypothetical protein